MRMCLYVMCAYANVRIYIDENYVSQKDTKNKIKFII